MSVSSNMMLCKDAGRERFGPVLVVFAEELFAL